MMNMVIMMIVAMWERSGEGLPTVIINPYNPQIMKINGSYYDDYGSDNDDDEMKIQISILILRLPVTIFAPPRST